MAASGKAGNIIVGFFLCERVSEWMDGGNLVNLNAVIVQRAVTSGKLR